ncbi:hypothetical protein BH20ACI2_BH20ACI2_17630 [soil metagenome]
MFVGFFFALIETAGAQSRDWKPVTPQELQLTEPKVEAGADAEAIFWETRIDDSSSNDLSLKHYVRVKVFTERGRDKYSKFDVPFTKGTKIKDLAARVIRPDGSIVDIGKNDIFEREIIRTSGIKVKAKSFAVPNIEPGVLVEYRYSESVKGAGAMGMRLQFERDVPVQNLSYYYKPYNGREPGFQSYNLTGTKFEKDKSGYWLAARQNVPAFKEEPFMPPDDMVRAWMLITGVRVGIANASAFSLTFTIKDPSNTASYWGAVSAERAFLTKFMTKSNKDVQRMTEEVTAGAATTDEKLRRIYDFCQNQIANTSFDTSLTEEQREKLPEAQSIGDVLKRRSGSAQYIDMLFGAMANAIGLESRVGLIGNRDEMLFEPKMTNEKLLHLGVVGVNVGTEWKLFNPGMKFLPYGMLIWQEQKTWALLIGEKQYAWVQTPLTKYDQSQVKRSAKLALAEDGTLDGEVTMEYTGHPAIAYRRENYDESPEKREGDLKDEIKSKMSSAGITNVWIDNVEDPSKTLVKRYKVRVPNYAQKTGKRMFVQPGFFEYGSKAVFSESGRKYDIFFRYPWSEVDSVEIKLPSGFELDNADAPGRVADPANIGSLDVEMSIDRTSNLLKYNRKFHFGNGSNTVFDSSVYQPLKNLFDEFHRADSHTITLRQK